MGNRDELYTTRPLRPLYFWVRLTSSPRDTGSAEFKQARSSKRNKLEFGINLLGFHTKSTKGPHLASRNLVCVRSTTTEETNGDGKHSQMKTRLPVHLMQVEQARSSIFFDVTTEIIKASKL